MTRLSACCAFLAFSINQADTNPVGGSVVGGSANATITGQGTRLTTINQNAQRVIINWQEFSIGRGEVTKFVQPSSSAIALNRVVSGNPSEIYGSLQANGRVAVINPNGILVGRGGQVDTKGFLASTRDVGNANFLAGGALTLSGNSTAPIRNEGAIQALGGDVFLVAHTVENAGVIRATEGTVGLAAGSEVRLTQSGNERLSVLAAASDRAPAPVERGINNVGVIEAASAELKAAGGNIYALAINNGGVVRANSIVHENGRIVLKAAGGNIHNSGTLSASSASGSGGSVVVDGGHSATTPSSVVNSGTIEARGEQGRGGTVALLGDNVKLTGGASVDVSGQTGGGKVLIGGDYQGQNPNVLNAQNTTVERGVEIRADALGQGNGGRVIVWSDGSTRFDGNIFARALGVRGRGGFAEISGKDTLAVGGIAYLQGVNGADGTLLLDPGAVDIVDGPNDATGQPNTFNDLWVINQLALGSLIISTADATGGGAENLTVVAGANVTWAGANNLTLIGGDSVTVNGVLGNATGGALTLESPNGNVTINNNLNFGGVGSPVTVTAAGDVSLNDDVTAGTFSVRSGTDGSGNIGFGTGVRVQAPNQSYRAGDGTGGGGIASFADLVTNDPEFRNMVGSAQPGNFTYRQDAAIADAAIPDDNQFGGDAPGSYTIRSDDGSITLNDGSKVAGSALTLMANGNITIDVGSLAGGNSLTSLEATAGGDIALNDDITADSVTVHAGTDGTGNVTFARDDDDSEVEVRADVQSYRAGDGPGGAGATANANLISNGPVFRNTDDDGAPDSFTYWQDAAITAANVPDIAPLAYTIRSDDGGVQLPALDLPGTLSVIAAGDITQSGALIVDAGSSTFTIQAVTADILLGGQANNFDNETVTIGSIDGGTVRNVSLRNIDADALFPALPAGLNDLAVTFNAAPITVPALTLSGDLTLTSGGTISQSGAISADGLIAKTLNNSGAAITLNNAANDVASVDLRVRNAADNANADGPITYRDATGFDVVAAHTTDDVTLTAGGAVTGSGTVIAEDLTAKTLNDAGASITLAAPGNNVATIDLRARNAADTADAAGAITYRDANGFAVAALRTASTAVLTGGDDITQSGVIAANHLTVKTLNDLGADITLNNAGNEVAIIDLRARNAADSANAAGAITYRDATGLEVAAARSAGSVSLTAGDAVTQSGAIEATTLTVRTRNDAGSAITLDRADNDVTAIDLRARNAADTAHAAGPITYRDASGFDVVAARTADTVTLTAGDDISQSGAIEATTLTAKTLHNGGADITLDHANNEVTRVDLRARNAADTANADGAITYRDATGLDVAAARSSGSVTLIGGDAITQSGAIIASSLTVKTRNNAGATITLADLLNEVTAIDLRARNAADTANAAADIIYRDASGFDVVAAHSASTVTLTAADAITGSGTVQAAALHARTLNDAGAAITLGNANNEVTTVDLRARDAADAANTAGALTYRDATGFDVAAAHTASTVSLTGGDDITQSGTVLGTTLTAKTLNNGVANITLNNAGNEVGAIDLRARNATDTANAAGNITYRDATGFNVTAAHSAGTVRLTAGDAINGSGSVAASALIAKTLNDAGAAITLGNSANDAGTIDLRVRTTADDANAAGGITYRDANGFDVVAAHTAGTIHLTGGDDITGSGTIAGTILTATTFRNGGASITLNNSGNEVNIIDLRARNGADTANAAGSISYRDATGFDVAAAHSGSTVELTAGDAITESGTIDATTLTARTLNDAGAAITLGNGNDADRVHLQVRNAANSGDAAGAIVYRDVNGFEVGSVNTLGNASLQSGGPVDQSGAIRAAGLQLLGSGPYVLDGANDITRLAASAGGNIIFNDENSLDVGLVNTTDGISAGGNVVLTAPDLISNTRDIVAGGDVRLTANTMDINRTVRGDRVTLLPFSFGRAIELGNERFGRLSLTQSEVNQVNAGILQIGDLDSGEITISGALAPTSVSTLTLRSGGSITEVGDGAIVVRRFCIVTDPLNFGSKVELLGNNDWDFVAAGGRPVTLNDINDFSTAQAIDDCDEHPSFDRGQPSFVPVGSELIRFQGADKSVASSAALAGLSSITIPAPRLDRTSFSGAEVSAEEAAQILPAGSIGTLWLQVPFERSEEERYKIEDISKWTSGRVATVGSTTGPQTPR